MTQDVVILKRSKKEEVLSDSSSSWRHYHFKEKTTKEVSFLFLTLTSNEDFPSYFLFSSYRAFLCLVTIFLGRTRFTLNDIWCESQSVYLFGQQRTPSTYKKKKKKEIKWDIILRRGHHSVIEILNLNNYSLKQKEYKRSLFFFFFLANYFIKETTETADKK